MRCRHSPADALINPLPGSGSVSKLTKSSGSMIWSVGVKLRLGSNVQSSAYLPRKPSMSKS
jgi:hypothetical protein